MTEIVSGSISRLRMERRAREHAALANRTRLELLDHLRSTGGAGVDTLSERLGLHPNTVRSHLALLEDAGLVEGEPIRDGRPGRPRVRYVATPTAHTGVAGCHGYRMLADVLAGYLETTADQPEEVGERAGRAWGRHLAHRGTFAKLNAEEAVARLTEILDGLGFTTIVHDGDERWIEQGSCPFAEVAATFPAVTCALHLGLLRGALAELGAPLDVESLTTSVDPRICVARLRDTPRA